MSAQGKTFIRRRGTTAVPNSTVHDQRISLQALGILVVVLGRPSSKAGNGYRAFMGRGMGQTAILSALKELEAAGYRYQFTRRNGQGATVTDTVWSETPIDPVTAAAWHKTEIEAHESRGKEPKARKWKKGTTREIPRVDHAEDSTHGATRGLPRLVTSAPSLRDVQGSPTHYVRNGEPEISNAHEDGQPATSAVEDATPAPSASRTADAPQGQEHPQRPADGPQGVEAWHAVKARLAAQREERRAREAAEARVGRLTEPTDHHHPRPRTGVRA